MSKPYDRVTVGRYSDGRAMVINRRTYGLLQMTEGQLGFSPTIVQGSYNAATPASAGTHDGGGVVDLRTWNLTQDQRNGVLFTLRKFGAISWYRTAGQGFDPHIHFVMKGDAELSVDAKWQVSEAAAGRNGLASRGSDSSNLHVPTFDFNKYLEWVELTELADRVTRLEARVTDTTDARAQYAYRSVTSGGPIENRVSVVEGRVSSNTDARAQYAYTSVTEGTVAAAVADLSSRAASLETTVEDLWAKQAEHATRIASLEAAPKS